MTDVTGAALTEEHAVSKNGRLPFELGDIAMNLRMLMRFGIPPRAQPQSHRLTQQPEPLSPNVVSETHKSVSNMEIKVEGEGRHPLGIGYPWDCVFNISIRGAEYTHSYFWIIKDLAWTQYYQEFGVAIGCVTLAWCGLLLYQALAVKDIEEVYQLVAIFLWLYGNFWWLQAELIHNDDAVSQPQAAHILTGAISWLLLYHIVLQPLGIIKHNPDSVYVDKDLKCRWSYFKSWRQYEHIHSLFWIGKDLSWMTGQPIAWIICTFFTLSINLDFIWNTFWNGRMTIELVHYVSLLMWVTGNLLWAYDEVFISYDDEAVYIFKSPHLSGKWTIHSSGADDYVNGRIPYRWYSSWMLFAALWPLIIMYSVWLPLTYLKKIDPPTRESLILRLSSPSFQFDDKINGNPLHDISFASKAGGDAEEKAHSEDLDEEPSAGGVAIMMTTLPAKPTSETR